jgi:hypothetical protein
MRRLAILTVLTLAAAAAVLAQSGKVDPGEPEIVLPQIIMDIDDISVENVEAKLPPEEELLPPQRQIPQLTAGDIPVGEPEISLSPEQADMTAANTSTPALSVEALLGAGMENTIMGTLGVKTLGLDPRFSLSFSHQTVDGFAGHAPGSGFDMRGDGLSGELALKLGPVLGDLQGAYREDQRGLQGLSSYIGLLSRGVGGTAGFSVAPLDWLGIEAKVFAATDSLTLMNPVPFALSEYRLSPELKLDARVSWFRIALAGNYVYRRADFGPAGVQEIHRVRTTLSMGAELPASMLLEGSVAWFWNSAGASLFPFEVRFSGTPFGFLTFGFGGGYKVVPYDMGDVLASSPWLFPQALSDDSGWFVDSTVQFSVAKDLTVSGKLSFMASSAMIDAALDPATGLFLISERPAYRLEVEAGIRWTALAGITLGANWTHEILDRPAFVALDRLAVEGIAIEGSGAFGGDFSVAIQAGTTPSVQLPIVNIGGFIRITEAVQLHLDLDDLLQPALGGPRYGLYPYEEPGFRVIAQVRLSF